MKKIVSEEAEEVEEEEGVEEAKVVEGEARHLEYNFIIILQEVLPFFKMTSRI